MAGKKRVYDFVVKNINGEEVRLSSYRGKVLLVVNIASGCGETPQLKGLQNLYLKYKDAGFEILGFPSNQFLGQEPLEGSEIVKFCQMNYEVTFPIFQKGKVRGKDAQPLYKFLSNKTENGITNFQPLWNFSKYLVDKNGMLRDYFWTWTRPDADKLTAEIEKCIAEKAVEN